jgi:hypothetical protein
MEKQRSRNWARYEDFGGRMRKGYPFDEGFPREVLFGNKGDGTYTLILDDGKRTTAQVDYSAQYREGKKWKTIDGIIIDARAVAAWRRADG